MNNYPFLNFILIHIYKNRLKHLSIFIISTFLILVLFSFIFISTAIQKDIKLTIKNQADFIVQKIRSGKVVDSPNDWANEFISIDGVSIAIPRVYGKYFYEPAEHYFTIIGVDFFDKQVINSLKELVQDIDIEDFLDKQNMIIGSGVKAFLDNYSYFKYYTFRTPNRSIKKVYIYNNFPNTTNIISSDMIIMDINLARKILGIKKNRSTDILLNIPNNKEHETVINKIRISHFDTRIIKKDDFLKAYDNFFNYKTTIFLILYMIVLITFILILYQRYSLINKIEKKEIGILRSLGWNIIKIIKLKVFENLIIFISSFILGVSLAYIFVFIFNAPFLSNIFLGFKNLPIDVQFNPAIDFGILSMLFLFFIVPIIATILIPIWKISITDPSEAMK
jgi:putative ABC transport system permease protein